MANNTSGLSRESIETIAGFTAGFASTVVAHPLDIIKTRLQLDTSSHPFLNSSRTVLREIWRNEGPTRIAALYRGLTPNLIGNSAGWGLYFLWYQQAQDMLRHTRGYTPDQKLTTADILSTSAAAGVLSAIFTNPIWVVKTRMLSTSATTQGAYTGTTSALASIWRTEGLRGYFHGLIPALVGVSHGAFYFLAYENLKRRWASHRSGDKISNLDTTLAASLSKVFASCVTYPSQVVRARLQSYDPSGKQVQRVQGLIGTTLDLWRNEGITGFYKGLGPNLARIIPSTCITFLVYENMKWALPKLFNNEETAISKKESAL